MDKATYDRKLMDVQEIAAQTGLKLLTVNMHYDDDGRMVEATWSNNGQTVFRQRHPFTEHTTYHVDEGLWRRLVYSDPTR